MPSIPRTYPRCRFGRAGLTVLLIAGVTACINPNRRARQRAFEERQAQIERQPVETEPGWRRRNKPRLTSPTIEQFRKLGESLGARAVPIEAPCLTRFCTRRALGRLFNKLDRIDEDQQGVARVLVLGDSHIAADYIVRAIRDRLQRRFGDAGRGFIAIDQKAQYGGRRLSKRYWRRTRIVDGNGPGKAFGFAGMRLDASRADARMIFELGPNDDDVVAYFLTHPEGSALTFYANDKRLGRIPTRTDAPQSRVLRIAMPERTRGDEPPTRFKIVAEGAHAALFGLSFESYEAGVLIDAIGPVGADAQTYLQLDRVSFRQHLRALDPDVVVLMLGGNDALAVRKGDRTLAEVEQQHLDLVDRLRRAVPDADCLLWSPLDAAVRKGKRVDSKAKIVEVRDVQQRVASRMRCAFWDAYEAMGGRGAFGRWLKEGLMNRDLVHPRARGGDLIGHLFATALMNAYLTGS